MAFDSSSSEWQEILSNNKHLIDEIDSRNPFFVDEFSLKSLFIQPSLGSLFKKTEHYISLSSATGFVVRYRGNFYLITNRHVVTGRDTETNKCLDPSLALPENLTIWHHTTRSIKGYGAWTIREEKLYQQNGEPRWIEHPAFSIKNPDDYEQLNVDVVALPLAETDSNVLLHTLDIENIIKERVAIPPGQNVSIVGFPLGRSAESFPIWKTGHIASDMFIHAEYRHFYIDATTKSGMSGSPVYSRSIYINSKGEIIENQNNSTKFIGVYSGRITSNADIGIVWQPKLIQELIDCYLDKG